MGSFNQCASPNNIASALHFGFFGHEACGILVPWPGIEPLIPALEGRFLATGPSEKSDTIHFLDDTLFLACAVGLGSVKDATFSYT